MTRLILVRHGETQWNDELRFQGQRDVPLNDRGREQARRIGNRIFKDKDVIAVYSSDLSRSRDTAQPIADLFMLPVTIRPSLREASFGRWEGLTLDEVRQLYPEEAEGWMRDPARIRPADGETREQIIERVMGELESIASEHPEGSVVVVSHGGCIKCAIMCALDGPSMVWRKIRVDNASITVLLRKNGAFEVVTTNDRCHLIGNQ